MKNMSQVITYKNEGVKGVYSQIKLDSGERVLISIAADEIKIIKLKFMGSIPTKTVWNYPDLFDFMQLLKKHSYDKHPLDVLVDKVKEYQSINELKDELDGFIDELKK